jgi:integrase
MTLLIQSSDVFKKTELHIQNDGSYHCTPFKGNIGSLPTLFNQDGEFLHEPNSYLFYLKAIKGAKDLNPCSQALLKYYQFLEVEQLKWDHFPPIKRLKPTYQFRSYLLKSIKSRELAHSTANHYMNHIKNYYLWAMSEGYLKIKREQEAPFKIEFINVNNLGMLAHIKPVFTVESSDLRIKVPRDSASKNIRPLSPLTQNSLDLLIYSLPYASEELRLQVLLSIDTGMRVEEVSTFTLDALQTATPIAESQHRYEITLCPQATGVQTKFDKQRRIEISVDLLQALRKYQASERRLIRANKLYTKIKQLSVNEVLLNNKTIVILEQCRRHEPLFISQQGNPVTSETVKARWSELRIHIQQINETFKYRFHDLRATYGTYRLNDLLEANLGTIVSLELLMGWMGHKNESTTWKYLRFLKRKEIFKVKFGILDSIMHEAIGDENE